MRMPVMDGAQLLEQVRQRWPQVTRILLTGHSDAGLEQQVLDRTTQLSTANARLGKNYLGSIKAFSNLIELHRGSTAGHSRRVAELARRIAVQMKLPVAEAQSVFIAGLLHDIGHV